MQKYQQVIFFFVLLPCALPGSGNDDNCMYTVLYTAAPGLTLSFFTLDLTFLLQQKAVTHGLQMFRNIFQSQSIPIKCPLIRA